MNYKMQAAAAAAKLIKQQQTIGLGAGSTIAYLVDEISANATLSATVGFVSSSAATTALLLAKGLIVADAGLLPAIDVYFDGCDQLDLELNALKSGGGIHTDEKVLAAMAKEFILLGDVDKLADKLNTTYPFTIELLPAAVGTITELLKQNFDVKTATIRTTNAGEAINTARGAKLMDVQFNTLPELAVLNQIKLWPGIVEHSLFYKIATGAIVCGPDGLKFLTAVY